MTQRPLTYGGVSQGAVRKTVARDEASRSNPVFVDFIQLPLNFHYAWIIEKGQSVLYSRWKQDVIRIQEKDDVAAAEGIAGVKCGCLPAVLLQSCLDRTS